MFCHNCNSQNDDGSNFCKICGINLLIQANMTQDRNISSKNWLLTLLLCIFFGAVGIHRFYVGKIGTGILMILTFGGFGIWVLVDLILIVTNAFTDENGLKLNKNLYRY
ncbi:TM2 domain-containing protein [Clostridium estertheticum]|uniref:TM2 domain-containing protein n=1 Tax=Clostridium estertheticum TaxID=238834 RepID=A0AA47EGH2_9CLOT|nr:TM2 domain-containing protein [Clostridium estertheticum]MBU3157433.1 TM2 domain-containing protein [Clostridium estertheticum]MBU3201886.1 TM2 domain-containing protein [Clostridium estertheticum]WAG59773.1 TM2 domain-containing protein [Clostridium estertheticum]WAG66156.1 TM2 domain-containing protein [Clostridium estertheticum]